MLQFGKHYVSYQSDKLSFQFGIQIKWQIKKKKKLKLLNVMQVVDIKKIVKIHFK